MAATLWLVDPQMDFRFRPRTVAFWSELKNGAGDSSSGSTIDLEAEIGRRTNPSRGGSSTGGSSIKGPGFASTALKNGGTGVPVAVQKVAPVQPVPEKGISRFLLIVGLILMFILAIFLGGVIAVLVISPPIRGRCESSHIRFLTKPATLNVKMLRSVDARTGQMIPSYEYSHRLRSVITMD